MSKKNKSLKKSKSKKNYKAYNNDSPLDHALFKEVDHKLENAETLAYFDRDFLNSSSARAIRILSEYIKPNSIFKNCALKDTIVFFGSARILEPKKAIQKYKETVQKFGKDSDEAKQVKAQKKMSAYYEKCRDLSFRLTEWSMQLKSTKRRFITVSGGGPGIMEAANRGASEAGGLSIGLNIDLPFEQTANPYITKGLDIDFNYFFMRKFWFTYLAKAMVVFPGGFGTMDEFFESMTLVQTKKITKQMPVVLFGSEFWNKLVNFSVLVDMGMIAKKDLKLFKIVDSVDDAFAIITKELEEKYL